MATDAHTRRVVAQVAKELTAQLPERTTELANLFLEEIPAFQGEEAVRELMAASTAANLSTMFDLLQHGLPTEQLVVPAAAAAYARRFAQRDLPLESLLRAYRLGSVRFNQWCLRGLSQRELDADVVLACTQEIVQVAGRYIDQISEHLVEIYETERKLWTQRTDAARAIALRTVLDDEALDLGTAEAMVGYRMRGWHVGAVAWMDKDVPDTARRLESAAQLLSTVHGRRPLAVLSDDHTLWAWVTSVEPIRLDHLGLAAALEASGGPLGYAPRMAIGEPAQGLDGFRTTHREAMAARSVAEAAESSPDQVARVVSFAEVSIAALLSENLDSLRTWVRRTLGALARDDEATERLRETVRIFLETGGSFTDAAARLHLHKNTVHYRVRKAEEIRGRPLSEGRLDVEVALVACRQLGSRVLSQAG
ncbi:helix-turn-helix domain-containing protein [Pseudonocardia eucalypti]|uniref:Helix-turn-helix domain-containing protein n=1 Tax=Pseudonocardia eucalypti TaxID=648755 RepID=A0ABP9QDG4_9PSEU|nr:DNA-binding PucR family transcriptional regulator [Pseudonocardia eucalypti]